MCELICQGSPTKLVRYRQFDCPDAPEGVDVMKWIREHAVKREPKPCSGCGKQAKGTTRASCIECCEKHLGAAAVLIDETHDGYDYRLRAIGHMHEAADESQAWPDLHAAIREARKAYQGQGTVPDWNTLGELAAAVRTDAKSATVDEPEPGERTANDTHEAQA